MFRRQEEVVAWLSFVVIACGCLFCGAAGVAVAQGIHPLGYYAAKAPGVVLSIEDYNEMSKRVAELEKEVSELQAKVAVLTVKPEKTYPVWPPTDWPNVTPTNVYREF